MDTRSETLNALITQVRSSFNRLKTIAETMHQDLGINPSMRAVLEFIVLNGAQTVPDIARAKSVSRQHIQVNMDALVTAGLAVLKPNPAHKRSHLYTATANGIRAFDTVRQREATVLKEIAAEIPAELLTAGQHALEVLNESLAQEIEKGKQNDVEN